MGKYIVIFKDNHKDEFDVNGFKLMTEKESDKYEELALSINYEFEFWANNECLTYVNGEDLLSRIEFKSISNEEYDSLDKLFGGEFGTFISEDFLNTILDGADEDNDVDESYDDDDNW